MLRLTFTLAVALYAGLVIWGDPVGGLDGAAQASAEAPVEGGSQVAFARPVIVERGAAGAVEATRAAPSETIVPEASVIAASAPRPSGVDEAPARIGEPTRVSLIAPAERSDAAEAAGERMVVTGSRVNLRAGPSTANAVLDSLPRGTVVEVLRQAGGNWVELRDPASGRVGYMSSRFLAPS